MSRIGKLPVPIPEKAKVSIDGQTVSVEGPKGSLKKSFDKAANKIAISKIVGESLAEKIKDANIERIIFDRNGYKYHGRVKVLAEAIRSAEIII